MVLQQHPALKPQPGGKNYPGQGQLFRTKFYIYKNIVPLWAGVTVEMLAYGSRI